MQFLIYNVQPYTKARMILLHGLTSATLLLEKIKNNTITIQHKRPLLEIGGAPSLLGPPMP